MAFARVDQFALLWRGRGLTVLLEPVEVPKHLSLLTFGQRRGFEQQFQRRTPPPPPPSGLLNPNPMPTPRNTVAEPKPLPVRTLAPPSSWPKDWRNMLCTVKTGHVVWTYPELGSDLLRIKSQNMEVRRDFLKRILHESPCYPPGTHTFWPYRLVNNGALGKAEPILFWSGVEAVQARIVICLGSDACTSLLGIEPAPYTIKRMYQFQVLIAQNIQELATQPNLYKQLMLMMRSILRKHAIHPVG